ncbi:hypothetical protein L1049_016121 [Liquidambar formosana]|uniref:Plastid lipid-associated protein/fibrillin conserved domain-containing protein n=1 Tax=Liquidambar formosana TaxID=63359 RepID=A0AAP0S0S0_LIQFO
MSSLLQSPPTFLSHSSSTSSSSYSSPTFTCILPTNLHSPNRRHPRTITTTTKSKSRRWNHLLRSALDEVSVLDPPPPPPPKPENENSELIASLKLKLLSAVSGLNRGLAANEDDIQKADAAAKEIEAVGGPVFQRIDILSKDFDNIVELQLGVPWPLEPVAVTATLAHKFELIGSSNIRIIFEKTTVKTTGNLSQLPLLEIPRIPDSLRPPSNTGSGEFKSPTSIQIPALPEEIEAS